MPLERKEVKRLLEKQVIAYVSVIKQFPVKNVAILKQTGRTHGIQQSTVMAGSTFSGEAGLGSAPTLSLTSCVTWSKLHMLSALPFPPL